MTGPAPRIVLAVLATAALGLACGAGGDKAEKADKAGKATEASSHPAPAPEAAPSLREEVSGTIDPSLRPVVDVLAEPDPFLRIARLATLLRTFDPAAAPHLPGLLRNVKIDLDSLETGLLVEFWASHDAKAASQWALFRSPPAFRSTAIEAAFPLRAAEDPQAAAQELAAFQMVPGPYRETAEKALISGWFDSGKPGLTDYIQKIGVGFARQRAIATYARKLVQRDGAKAAIAWADSVPDDDATYKMSVLRQTGSSVAMLDPQAAAAWCDRVCSDKLASNVRAMVAQRWAALDGPAAMAWVSKAPDDRERLWAVKAAFWGFWRHDPDGFEHWIDAAAGESLPAWLEPAVEIYAAQLVKEDPHAALAWAGRIKDDTTRQRALVNVARFWRKHDQAAADAWLEQSPLSEEERESVQHPEPGRAKPAKAEEKKDDD